MSNNELHFYTLLKKFKECDKHPFFNTKSPHCDIIKCNKNSTEDYAMQTINKTFFISTYGCPYVIDGRINS